jgi:hypothetical protein
MVFKTLLIVLVFAVLMEDSLSIKKTAEEEKEDREIAEKVNATLAEEAEKKKEEEDEAKRKKKVKTQGEEKDEDKKKEKQEKDEDRNEKEDSQDEACLPANITCPVVKPCPPCKDCKDCPKCGPCPGVDPCKPCDPCGPCPPIFCQPCPTTNSSIQTPSNPGCPEASGMTMPMAVAVGAVSSILVMGLATAVGLIIRYLPPFISGFILIVALVMVWYLSSRYPEVARELGERVVETLRAATATLSHRVVEALQRHNNQVSFSY